MTFAPSSSIARARLRLGFRAACLRAAVASAACVGAALLAAAPARADLRICNNTGSRVGLAIGYLDGEIWVTEGWFNLKPNLCETIVQGQLSSRFYYLHAVDYDRGGEWAGSNLLCTRETEFSIRGTNDCYARGFERSGFAEVDTGRQADWTVELSEGGFKTDLTR